jgi:hypothetical protein
MATKSSNYKYKFMLEYKKKCFVVCLTLMDQVMAPKRLKGVSNLTG